MVTEDQLLENAGSVLTSATIVVPVGAWSDSVEPLLDCVSKSRLPLRLDVVVVDDGSLAPSATRSLTAAVARRDVMWQVLQVDDHPGRMRAVQGGVEAAAGDFVVVCEPESVDRIGEIPGALALAWLHGADAVVLGRGATSPEGLPVERMISWMLPIGTGTGNGAVILRRFVARWMFHGLTTESESLARQELVYRSRHLGVRMIELDNEARVRGEGGLVVDLST